MTHIAFASSRDIRRSESMLLVEEITHRVVNEYSVAIASIRLAATRTSDPNAQATLCQLAARLQASAEAHRALQPPTFVGDYDLGQYLEQVCAALVASSLSDRGVRLTLLQDIIPMAPQRCWRVGLIVAELVGNAVKHGAKGDGGLIMVRVSTDGRDVRCQVADNGGSLPNPAASRGRRLVIRLAEDLRGSIDWRFQSGGVSALLVFPMANNPTGHFESKVFDNSTC